MGSHVVLVVLLPDLVTRLANTDSVLSNCEPAFAPSVDSILLTEGAPAHVLVSKAITTRDTAWDLSWFSFFLSTGFLLLTRRNSNLALNSVGAAAHRHCKNTQQMNISSIFVGFTKALEETCNDAIQLA